MGEMHIIKYGRFGLYIDENFNVIELLESYVENGNLHINIYNPEKDQWTYSQSIYPNTFQNT